jgi:AcrR family transcriptional regulator
MVPMTAAETAPADRRAPGRPRSARADEAIIDAVISLLEAGTPVEALSIEAVAARAGVGKATIYRRWPNKDALLVDAVTALKGPLPEIGGVSVRDDLCTLLRPVGQNSAMIRSSSVLPCLIPELRRSPELHQVYQRIIEPRRELMRGVFRRGIESGELRPDLDLEVAMAMLVGPMLAQSIVNWNPGLDRATLPERLVDTIWPAIAARP